MLYKRNRNQWFILAALLFFMGGAVASGLYRDYHATLRGEDSRLLAHSEVIRETLSQQLITTDKILLLIRDRLSGKPHTNWQTSLDSGDLSFYKNLIPGIRTLLVVDAEGTIRLTSRPEVFGKDVSFRDYYSLAKSQAHRKQIFLTPPFQTLLNAWTMNLIRIIPGRDGSFRGMIVASLDETYFRALLKSANYAPDMWSAIAHSSGVQFSMVPHRTGQPGLNLLHPGSLFLQHKHSKRETSLLTGKVQATGEYRIMALKTIHPGNLALDHALVISISRDLNSLLGIWYKSLLQEGGIFLFICLLSVALLFFYQRRQQTYHKKTAKAEEHIREKTRRLEQATLGSRIGIWEFNSTTATIYLDAYIFSLFQIKPHELDSELPIVKLRRYVLPEDRFHMKRALVKAIRDGRELDEEFRIQTGRKKIRYLHIRARTYNEEPGTNQILVGICEDITEWKMSQIQLHKITHGIEQSASAVLITDTNGCIEYVNQKFCQITGFRKEEVIGENPRILKSEGTPPEVFDDLWRTILSGKEWRGELLNRRKNGEVYWSISSISPLRNERNVITHFIANVEDISERKNAEMMIEQLAYYDPLTGLPNRRLLRDRIELGIKRSRRQGGFLALLFIDLDSFKNINDSLGHQAGDKFLQYISRKYVEHLREDDFLCRLGGDEFAVILHDLTHTDEAALVLSW